MKYKAIIYDIDGTLLDTIAMNMYPLIKVIYEQTGIKKTYDEVKHFFSMSGKATMEALGFDYDEIYPIWVRYVNEYEKGAEVYEGVLKMVSTLDSLNICQAIVSSKEKKQYEIDMKDSGLEKYIKTTILFEDTKKHKPDPEPLLACLDQLGLEKAEVCYIGDALSDGQASVAAGIDFIHARWANLGIEPINRAVFVANTVEDCLEYLLNA